MHLKSLSLRGFKSFADRAIIKFERGITVVVGPNGSGKSNITDAIMWVLGEQSPRALRGGSMEDVIFAGSATRQAVGVAEVVLVLDNSDGDLPIEFAEVTIARRVYRTGESEYYLNNSPCRLLDIHEILSGSGLGRGLYSIIGQGKIEEALMAKPEERRVFIEEAAGVLKYKRRRDRAVKRLSTMEANLVRIRDIMTEINRQLGPLKRQADRARKHHEIAEELKGHELSWAVVELKDMQTRWTAAEQKQGSTSQAVSTLEARVLETERAHEATITKLQSEEASAGQCVEKRQRARSAIDRLEAVASLVREKTKNAEDRMESMTAETYRKESRRLALENKLQQGERELEQMAIAIKRGEERIAENRDKLQAAAASSKELAEKLKELERRIQGDEKVVVQTERSCVDLELSIEKARAQLTMLTEQRAAIEKRRTELESALAYEEAAVEALKDAVEALTGELAGVEKKKAETASEQGKTADEAARAEREAEACRSRVKALKDTLEVDPDASAAFKQSGDSAVAILGEAITVPQKYERAIEALLDRDLFLLVLKDADALRQLAASGTEKLSVLPLEIAKSVGTPEAGLTPAIEVIECDAKVRPAVNALLSGIYIVESLDAALKAERGGITVVTLDGQVVYPSGKVVLGVRSSSVGQLARRREIDELESGLIDIQQRAQTHRTRHQELTATLRELTAEEMRLTKELAAKKGEVKAGTERSASFSRSLVSVDKECASLDERKASVVVRLQEEEAKIISSRESLTGLKNALESLKSELATARTDRETRLKEESEISLEANKSKMELDALYGRRRGLERGHRDARTELAEILVGLDKDHENKTKLVMLLERSIPLMTTLDALSSFARQVFEEADRIVKAEEGELERLREAAQEQRGTLSILRADLEVARKAATEVEVTKAQLEMEVSNAVARIVDDLDMPLEKALERPIELSREELEQRISTLRQRLAAIGPINPLAIGEYEELERRSGVFIKQMEDVTESGQALAKVVRAIDRKIKERFVEAYKEINEHFKEIFAGLFPGGYAELVMTEPDDPDATGVEVVAQPSGKKVQRLSLLSGGEKSLISLAFLFSLYLSKPAPFYILDEAEAALDDVNLHRLNKLLLGRRSHTQFLIVTHQRRTMESGDALYGVSMQADGVSKLLSQKLTEIVEVM